MTVCFVPVWLSGRHAPTLCRGQATVWSLLYATAALALFLFVTLLALGKVGEYLDVALRIVAIGAAPVWLGALAIRYLPWPGLFRAALVAGMAGVYVFFVQRWVNSVLGEPVAERSIDFFSWQSATIQDNVTLLTSMGLLSIAAVLAIVGGVRSRQG